MSKFYTVDINSRADQLVTTNSVDELKADYKNLSDTVTENEKIIVSLSQRYEHFLDVQEKHQATLREYRQNSNHIDELLTENIQSLSENQRILSQNTDDNVRMLKCLIDLNEHTNRLRFKRYMWFLGIFGLINIATLVLHIVQLFIGA